MVLHGFDKQIRCEGFIQESNHVTVGDSIWLKVRAKAGHIDYWNVGRRRVLEQLAAYLVAFHVRKDVIEKNQIRRIVSAGAQTFLGRWRGDDEVIGFSENFFHEAEQHQTVIDYEHLALGGTL